MLTKNKIPKEGFDFICLTVILVDSIFETDKQYYPRMFLEESKYDIKEKKMTEYITDNKEISSDSDREDYDEENSNEQNPDEKNFERKLSIECFQ